METEGVQTWWEENGSQSTENRVQRTEKRENGKQKKRKKKVENKNLKPAGATVRRHGEGSVVSMSDISFARLIFSFVSVFSVFFSLYSALCSLFSFISVDVP
ncbi:MAG: hypothetical protein A3G87_06850 [Omnitrophica bacterium RIFCSPLOWO2_12_FULL_50_11]|nr:MAG: hypothetical protein A3G87_06850 [Omnitrophica bacterium RIFCSPLOWO2_12_FULL_50_11]